MCGVVGYVGPRQAAGILLDGLRRMEYRGYDSAGIAVINGTGLKVHKAAGKLSNLEKQVADHLPAGTVGIGPTRWATPGAPTPPSTPSHRASAPSTQRALRQKLIVRSVTFSQTSGFGTSAVNQERMTSKVVGP